MRLPLPEFASSSFRIIAIFAFDSNEHRPLRTSIASGRVLSMTALSSSSSSSPSSRSGRLPDGAAAARVGAEVGSAVGGSVAKSDADEFR